MAEEKPLAPPPGKRVDQEGDAYYLTRQEASLLSLLAAAGLMVASDDPEVSVAGFDAALAAHEKLAAQMVARGARNMGTVIMEKVR